MFYSFDSTSSHLIQQWCYFLKPQDLKLKFNFLCTQSRKSWKHIFCIFVLHSRSIHFLLLIQLSLAGAFSSFHGAPVYHRANIDNLSRSHSHLWPTCLDCGRKTGKSTQNMLHTEQPQPVDGFQPRISLLWGENDACANHCTTTVL